MSFFKTSKYAIDVPALGTLEGSASTSIAYFDDLEEEH
jgi:hypothetical protein